MFKAGGDLAEGEEEDEEGLRNKRGD